MTNVVSPGGSGRRWEKQGWAEKGIHAPLFPRDCPCPLAAAGVWIEGHDVIEVTGLLP